MDGKKRSIPSPFENLAAQCLCLLADAEAISLALQITAGLDTNDTASSPRQPPAQPPPQRVQASAGPRPPSLASSASLARGGFLMIRDIWAGRDPGGHRHETPGARRKRHLHSIEQCGGSRRLPAAAAQLPGDTKGPGWGRRGGRPPGEGQTGVVSTYIPCTWEMKATGFVSLSLPMPTGHTRPEADLVA